MSGYRDERPRYDPAPLRERIERHGLTYRAVLEQTPWQSVETVGALIRGDANERRAEGLTWWQADRLAVALGCHPTELWDDWHDEELSA